MKLVDLKGRPVHDQHWASASEEQSVEWDVSSQSLGVYLLQALSTPLEGPAKAVTLKIIKP